MSVRSVPRASFLHPVDPPTRGLARLSLVLEAGRSAAATAAKQTDARMAAQRRREREELMQTFMAMSLEEIRTEMATRQLELATNPPEDESHLADLEEEIEMLEKAEQARVKSAPEDARRAREEAERKVREAEQERREKRAQMLRNQERKEQLEYEEFQRKRQQEKDREERRENAVNDIENWSSYLKRDGKWINASDETWWKGQQASQSKNKANAKLSGRDMALEKRREDARKKVLGKLRRGRERKRAEAAAADPEEARRQARDAELLRVVAQLQDLELDEAERDRAWAEYARITAMQSGASEAFQQANLQAIGEQRELETKAEARADEQERKDKEKRQVALKEAVNRKRKEDAAHDADEAVERRAAEADAEHKAKKAKEAEERRAKQSAARAEKKRANDPNVVMQTTNLKLKQAELAKNQREWMEQEGKTRKAQDVIQKASDALTEVQKKPNVTPKPAPVTNYGDMIKRGARARSDEENAQRPPGKRRVE